MNSIDVEEHVSSFADPSAIVSTELYWVELVTFEGSIECLQFCILERFLFVYNSTSEWPYVTTGKHGNIKAIYTNWTEIGKRIDAGQLQAK